MTADVLYLAAVVPGSSLRRSAPHRGFGLRDDGLRDYRLRDYRLWWEGRAFNGMVGTLVVEGGVPRFSQTRAGLFLP